MQISQLSDDQLLAATKSWALREQECSIELLKHLVEVHYRSLWAGVLFVVGIHPVVGVHGKPYEREGALRFILRNAEAEKALETGKINLSQAASMERVLRKEEKETKIKVQPEVVEILISQVEGRSKRETEKVLLAYHPEEVPKERLKQLTETLSQANFPIDEETRRNLEKYWNLRGKTSLREVFSECLRFFVEQKIEQKDKRPKEKKATITPTLPEKLEGVKPAEVKSSEPLHSLSKIPLNSSKTPWGCRNPQSSRLLPPGSSKIPPSSRKISTSLQRNSAHRKRTRYIPRQVKRQARETANNQCEYTDERTGRRCESRHLL